MINDLHRFQDLKQEQIAESSIKLLKDGISNGNKHKIKEAYNQIENNTEFNWDNLDVLFMEWDELTNEANDILLD